MSTLGREGNPFSGFRWCVDGGEFGAVDPRAPSALAQPCPDVEVVFARGTTEAPGLGPTGEAFVDSLRSRIGASRWRYIQSTTPPPPTSPPPWTAFGTRAHVSSPRRRTAPTPTSCSAASPRAPPWRASSPRISFPMARPKEYRTRCLPTWRRPCRRGRALGKAQPAVHACDQPAGGRRSARSMRTRRSNCASPMTSFALADETSTRTLSTRRRGWSTRRPTFATSRLSGKARPPRPPAAPAPAAQPQRLPLRQRRNRLPLRHRCRTWHPPRHPLSTIPVAPPQPAVPAGPSPGQRAPDRFTRARPFVESSEPSERPGVSARTTRCSGRHLLNRSHAFMTGIVQG